MPRPAETHARIAALHEARLPSEFYRRDALTVARELVGCVLVHRRRAGVIVETEAYLGPEDAASHARFGPTPRNSVMFGPGGRSYVYLCYGIHELFNIITGVAGEGQAVLVRAIAPYAGLPDDATIGRGPGKLTTALAIDRRHDRKDLTRGPLFVARGGAPVRIATGPRIGVAYAGDWAHRPFRFWWSGHASVSGPKVTERAQGRPSPPPAGAPTVSTRRRR